MTTKQFKRQWWVNRALQDHSARVIAVTAGLGAGKTHGLCDWHYHRCVANRHSNFSGYLLPTYQKVFDSAIPTFKKVFDGLGLHEGPHYKVIKAPFPKIILKKLNNHEIHFISGNRPDKIVAVEYSHLTGDEAGTLQEESIKLARTRVRCPDATIRQVALGGITMGEIGYFPELFDTDYKNNAGQWAQWYPGDYINRQRKLRRFRLSTYDNPFMPHDYISNLLDTFGDDPNYVKAWILGYFVPLWKGSAYTFNPARDIIENIDPDPNLDIYLSFDFNACPLAFICCQKVRFDEHEGRTFKFIAYDEAQFNNTHLEDACAEFIAKHPIHIFQHTPIRIFGDRSGYSDSHRTRTNDYEEISRFLKQHGYKRVYIEALTHNPLETISVEALNRWLQSEQHKICRRCVNYTGSLLKTRWRENVRKLHKPANDTWTHFGDAGKYLAYAVAQMEGQIIRGVNL